MVEIISGQTSTIKIVHKLSTIMKQWILVGSALFIEYTVKYFRYSSLDKNIQICIASYILV